MKKIDLLAIMSAPNLAKLSKIEIVTAEVIQKTCNFLTCQSDAIMKNIKE